MTNIAIEAMAIEIVDFPIKNKVMFYCYVSLPELDIFFTAMKKVARG